ncbi:MAG: orotate phosphoribosyltransferase [Candidatus Methanospirareceae archaeon]
MSWREEKENVGREIIRALYTCGMIKTWFRDNPEGWRLVSGLWSPLYIQLRTLSSFPELLKRVGYALGRLIKEECNAVNRIIGVATAGIPIATAVSLEADIPSCFTRKLEGLRSLGDFNNFIKEYGEHSMIEGILADGDTVGIVDDLVTRFDSKVLAIKQLEFEVEVRGLEHVTCSDVIVVLDREQGAEEMAREYGVKLHSLIPLLTKGMAWLKDVLADQEYEVIVDYLHSTEKYQDPRVQAELSEIGVGRGR